MEFEKWKKEAKTEVQNICDDVQHELEELRENGNEENRRLIEEAREKMSKMFSDTAKWLKENTEREKLSENLSRFRSECIQLLGQTKEKAIEISQNEDFQNTLRSGKEFIIGSGHLIASGVRAGADKLMENEKISLFVNRVNDRVEVIKEDERFQDGAQRLREGTMKVADRAYDGIKRILNKENDEE